MNISLQIKNVIKFTILASASYFLVSCSKDSNFIYNNAEAVSSRNMVSLVPRNDQDASVIDFISDNSIHEEDGYLVFDSWQDVMNTVDYLNEQNDFFLNTFHENLLDTTPSAIDSLELTLRNNELAPIEKFVAAFNVDLFYNEAFPSWESGVPLEDELNQFALDLFNDLGVYAVINQDFELIVDDTIRNLLADVFDSEVPITEPVDVEAFIQTNWFCPIIAFRSTISFFGTETGINPRMLRLITTHYRFGQYFGAMRVTARLENFERKGTKKWIPKRENIAVSTGGIRVNSIRCDDNLSTIMPSGIAFRKQISKGKFFNEPRAKLNQLPWGASGVNTSAGYTALHSY